MGEIEGDGEAGNVVGREPLFGQPDMRLETQTARCQFFVQPSQPLFQRRRLNAERQVAQTRVKEFLVGQGVQGSCRQPKLSACPESLLFE